MAFFRNYFHDAHLGKFRCGRNVRNVWLIFGDLVGNVFRHFRLMIGKGFLVDHFPSVCLCVKYFSGVCGGGDVGDVFHHLRYVFVEIVVFVDFFVDNFPGAAASIE